MGGGSQAGRPLQADILGTATSLVLAAAPGQEPWGLQEGASKGFSRKGVLLRSG